MLNALSVWRRHVTSRIDGTSSRQNKNQFVQAGFNPLKQIAKDLKKDINEVVEMMANGEVSAKIVKDSFINATKAGGDYFGYNDRMAKTQAIAQTKMVSEWQAFGRQVGDIAALSRRSITSDGGSR